jgi:hypothetical protein
MHGAGGSSLWRCRHEAADQGNDMRRINGVASMILVLCLTMTGAASLLSLGWTF